MGMNTDGWARRHAVQIVSALPEDVEEALLVLELARELITGFMSGKVLQPLALAPDRDRGRVVSLSSATNGANR